MPVTKSAKRALRGSIKKGEINSQILTRLEKAVRKAKKSKANKDINQAVSLADRAAKINTIHKNKAARIKSSLSKLAKPEGKKVASKKTVAKKAAPQKAKAPAKKKSSK